MGTPQFLVGINDAEQQALLLEDGQRLPYTPVVNTASAVGLALGNWGSVQGGTGQIVPTPTTQTAPVQCTIAALVLRVLASGLFLVEINLQFQDSVDNDIGSHILSTRQSAGAGVLTAAVATAAYGYFGTGATGSSGARLAADAAGGLGLLLDGAPVSGGVSQYFENAHTSAGLNEVFHFAGIVGAAGPTLAAKTPFTLGNAVAFGLNSGSAGGNLSYSRLSMSVSELPLG